MYLAGDVDPRWRESLILPAATVPYWAAVKAGKGDVVVHGALPYGHTLVGPFHPRAFVEQDELLPVPGQWGELKRATHLENHERWRMREMAKADIVFAWLGNGSPTALRDAGAEIGLAYGIGKAVIVATPYLSQLQNEPLITELAWKMIVADTAKEAYERITADLDVTFERGAMRLQAKYDGGCTICRSSYAVGDTIYWSKKHGGMHVDCYVLANRPDEIDNVLFNSRLVQALRQENGERESECLELMTKNSMLERRLEELTKGADDDEAGVPEPPPS